jgi:GNAT acetyltransferase-like protein
MSLSEGIVVNFESVTTPSVLPESSRRAGRDNNGYAIRVITSSEEMECLRTFWEALNWHPNAQMDFFRLINETRVNTIRPHILLVERDGEPHGLVVGRIVREDFRCSLGYKTIRLGQVQQFSIIYGGLLGCDNEKCAEAVMGELDRMLKGRELDLVFFSYLNTTSHMFRLATRRPGVLCRDHLVVPQLHWKTKLPATQADFLQRLNKKHRYWLRRLEKLIEKDFPGQVSFRSFTDGQRLNELMNDMERVASTSYQRRLGAGFRNDVENARRLTFGAKTGWLRIYVLYLENQPRAFWMGTLYKNVFYSASTGYDPEYKKYELGTLTFIKMVEQLCHERVAAIDFGLGDALYKQRFGDQSWHEAAVKMFCPALHGMMLNIVRTSIEAPALWFRSFLRVTNLQQRVKTFWRRQLLKEDEA